MPLFSSKSGANFGVECSEALGRAHIAPFTTVHLPAKQSRGDCTLQKRKHRKFTGRTSGKKLRPIYTNTRVSEPINITINNEVPVDTEISARVMRRIRHEHEPSVCPVL